MLKQLAIVSKKVTSPFLSWFILAINADLKDLIRSHHFPDFQKKVKSSQGPWSGPMRVMRKKASLLLPWYNVFVTTDVNQLEEKMFPILLKCLRQIQFKSTQYASLIPSQILPSTAKLHYFKKAPIKEKDEKDAIEALLAPIVQQHKKEGLPLPVPDWMPRRDFAEESTPLKLPLARNDYTPPDELPRPTDDWITEEDLPRPVEDWPLWENLPLPVDDWILPGANTP